MKLRFRALRDDCRKVRFRRSGRQDRRATSNHAAEDSGCLLRSFAGSKNHFRKASSQRTMVIYAGVAKVFKRQAAQLSLSGVYADCALLHCGEKLKQGIGSHFAFDSADCSL